MTLTQVWGALVIFIFCPMLGALPLVEWITYALTRRKLSQIGTGNISVSAAFYHGGKLAGILAVVSEAAKGIISVLLARQFFPSNPAWELLALLALIVGRYWGGKGAGTTNVVWGILVHDWVAAAFVFLIGGVSFTIFRDRATGRTAALVLLCLMISLLHPQDSERIVAAIALCIFLGWIYQKIPDDLDLSRNHVNPESRKMFRFFQGDKAVLSLSRELDAQKIGQKAANLSRLKRAGYAVPDGWVLPAGDDSQPLALAAQPAPDNPLVVRSSAVGEDSETASAAGQYTSILNITDAAALETAIVACQTSYSNRSAARYRQDRDLAESSMAVLVQRQIRGVFSGVAFSRDPVNPANEAVAIEALPGDATRVVSGQVTPEQYRVFLPEFEPQERENVKSLEEIAIEGSGDVPKRIIREVAILARELEDRDRGIPQDLEWTHDGETLWLLQARPITTLRPIWTRKIAAEVIPGLIRPLTWSINRPLTCGVWGDIFSLVLGERARHLDFEQTATLHYSRAYFNATLLGEIFRRMGLPAESLEFLTRGAKFGKPPLKTTLRNLPGLGRLLQREWQLPRDFERENRRYFAPTLQALERQQATELSTPQLLERIDTILLALRGATYYSILAPLSLALRQAILKVADRDLDNRQTPEVSATRSLAELAARSRPLLNSQGFDFSDSEALFANLAAYPDILEQFNRWLSDYGYLSETATDIAVARWSENPHPARELFAQYLKEPPPVGATGAKAQGGKVKLVQQRLDIKGRVTETYSRFLAHLRACFLVLADAWVQEGLLDEPEEIFFLSLEEIRQGRDRNALRPLIQHRQRQLEADARLPRVPFIVYGDATPPNEAISPLPAQQRYQGIAASPGRVEGQIKVARSLQNLGNIDKNTILVVPYTDSGWSPVLARAGGLIAEVGGRLSHGAIVAREYGLPAVMDVRDATHRFRDGQQVRVDGSTGIIELL